MAIADCATTNKGDLKTMNAHRALLKREMTARLENAAVEHTAGHQPSYAGRYSLTTTRGARLEIMFEKEPSKPPHIWCVAAAFDHATVARFGGRLRSASERWAKPNKHGKLMFGLHAGLKVMPQLRDADLVRFTPKTIGEANEIIDGLVNSQVMLF